MQTNERPKPLAEGTFSQTPFSHILVYLLGKKLVGTLEINHQNNTALIYFREGMPAKVHSSLKGKGLGYILRDIGKITHDQLLACQKEMAVSGGLQGQILVRQGAINTATLVEGLRHQMVLKLLDVFSMSDASYAFYSNMNMLLGIGSDEMFPLDTYALLTAGARNQDTNIRMGSVLNILKERWLYLDSTKVLHRFKFNKEERDFCRLLLDEPRNMDEVIQKNLHPKSVVHAVLYVLMITKNLKISDTQTPIETTSSPFVTGASSFESMPPPTNKEHETTDPKIIAIREKIKAKAAEIASQNYFEMLEMPQGAPADEIRKAFFKLAKKFHPDKAAKNELQDLHETLEYIFSNMSEAHSTLIDPDAREEYINSINDGIERTSNMPESNDKNEVDDILNAENFYQKALVLLRRNQKDKALELVAEARKLNSKEGDYLGLWAYLKSQLRPLTADLNDLIPHMREAQTLNPKSERIHFYFGQMLMRCEHFLEARTQFEKVVEINPRNIEAKRQLRLMKMRHQTGKNKKGFFQKLLR